MKRPLTVLAAVFSVVFLLQHFGYWLLPITLIGAMVNFLINFKPSNRRHYGIVTMMSIFAVLVFLFANLTYDLSKDELRSTKVIQGKGIVSDVSHYDHGSLLKIHPWYDDQGNRKPYSILVLGDSHMDLGDQIAFEGSLVTNLRGFNEGSFNKEKYFREKGILGQVKGDSRYIGPSNRYMLRRNMDQWRQNHYNRLAILLPTRHGSILGELIFGISAVDDQDRLYFQNAGIIHILAISGLHVAMISMLLFKLLNLFFYDQRKNALIILFFTVLYCIYTGGQVSTVRATIMVAVHLGHLILYRRYDPSSSLSFALILMVLVNPLQVTSPGFLLSFGAVLSIFCIVPKIKVPYLNEDSLFSGSLRLMLGIQIGLSPVLVMVYHELPLYSIVANLLVLPILGMLIALSILVVIVSYLHFAGGLFIAGSVFMLVNYMLDVAETISSLPMATIPVGHIPIIFVLLYYAIVLLWVMGQQTYMRITTLVLVLALLIATIPNRSLEIDMMDVGNGDAIFIRYGRQVMLVDGGGQPGLKGQNTGVRVLKPFLTYHGIRKIDTVFVTHSDFDHIYGIIELLDLVSIERIILSEVYRSYEDQWVQVLKDRAREKGTDIVFVDSGDRMSLGDLEVDFLYPVDSSVRDNNNRHSLIVLLQLEAFSMLLTGDAYIEDEASLLEHHKHKVDDLDVLKVAHHGSKTSTGSALLECSEPEVALISVGRKNLYGHPSDEVVERLQLHSDHIYMTKDQGQISLTYSKGELKVDTYIETRK